MPSHTVTVTRTTTTSSTSAIIINTGYLRTIHGLLKLLQLILCAVVVGIMSYYFDHYSSNDYTRKVDLYMHLVATACMIATFVILLSCLISLATASILPKTTFEYLYHVLAFLLLIIGGIAMMAEHVSYRDYSRRQHYDYESKIAAGAIGIAAAILYLISAVMGYRVYRIG